MARRSVGSRTVQRPLEAPPPACAGATPSSAGRRDSAAAAPSGVRDHASRPCHHPEDAASRSDASHGATPSPSSSARAARAARREASIRESAIVRWASEAARPSSAANAARLEELLAKVLVPEKSLKFMYTMGGGAPARALQALGRSAGAPDEHALRHAAANASYARAPCQSTAITVCGANRIKTSAAAVPGPKPSANACHGDSKSSLLHVDASTGTPTTRLPSRVLQRGPLALPPHGALPAKAPTSESAAACVATVASGDASASADPTATQPPCCCRDCASERP
mmetsp:Transcript_15683/g.59502  ORF Transcript_15683/g.59502 Transcript_15683/m.59502 type:complete len:285 (+) Transcript_15683:2215-3069(+)